MLYNGYQNKTNIIVVYMFINNNNPFRLVLANLTRIMKDIYKFGKY